MLHVSAADGVGGAARAAYRFHRALTLLEDDGLNSRMLVGRKVSKDASVVIHTIVRAASQEPTRTLTTSAAGRIHRTLRDRRDACDTTEHPDQFRH